MPACDSVSTLSAKRPAAAPLQYNSASSDAVLSGYAGAFRGVLFTPGGLPDGRFRQYGYLPLGLFREGTWPPSVTQQRAAADAARTLAAALQAAAEAAIRP